MGLWGGWNPSISSNDISDEELKANIKAQLSRGATQKEIVPTGYRQVPTSGYPQYQFTSQPKTVTQLKAQRKKKKKEKQIIGEVSETMRQQEILEEKERIRREQSSFATPGQIVPTGYRQVPTSGYPQYQFTSQPKTVAQLKAQREKRLKEQKILKEVEEKRRLSVRAQKGLQKGAEFISKKSFKVGEQVGQAAAIGMRRQQIDFSREQQMLGQMFGGGSKIWGVNNNPVTINNDLHPSMSNPYDETSSMFGFGGRR